MRKLLAVAVAVTALGLGGQAYAQTNTDSETASSSVLVITPITIEKTADLRFGQFVRPTANGVIVINETSGNLDATGITAGLTSIQQLGGGRGRASFTVRGQANRMFTVVVPNTITLTGPGGGSMIVNGIASSLGVFNGTLSNTGELVVGVGGRLNVGANQTLGSYTGSITMTATYQ